jgi:hypothetical protein
MHQKSKKATKKAAGGEASLPLLRRFSVLFQVGFMLSIVDDDNV